MGFGKGNKGVILYDYSVIDIGALAALDCVLGSQAIVLEEDFRVIKIESYIKTEETTVPILVGVSDGAMDAATVEECLEARPTDSNSTLLERSHRAVFPMALVSGTDRNDVEVQKTLRWTFKNADGWKFWAYNFGEDAASADRKIFIFSKIYGVWVV